MTYEFDLSGPERLARLLTSVPAETAQVAVPNSAWSVGQTAGHVLAGLTMYRDALLGHPAAFTEIDAADVHGGIERLNVTTMPTGPLELPSLAGRIERTRHEAIEAAARRDTDVDWYAGLRLTPGDLLTVLDIEAWVHGHDIAGALGQPWEIPPGAACRGLDLLARVAGTFVNPRTAGSFTGHVAVFLDEGPRYDFVFRGGRLSQRLDEVSRPDCRLHTDAVTYLLMLYARIRPLSWAALRRVRVRGSRPWWAYRMARAIPAP